MKILKSLLIYKIEKNPQYLIYNFQYDPNHPNQIMWLLIHQHLEKPLEPSQVLKFFNLFFLNFIFH